MLMNSVSRRVAAENRRGRIKAEYTDRSGVCEAVKDKETLNAFVDDLNEF